MPLNGNGGHTTSGSSEKVGPMLAEGPDVCVT